MTQRIRVKYGPWILGEVSESAVYSSATEDLRRSTALFARNVVFDSNGGVHSRPSTQEVAGSFSSTRWSGGRAFVFHADYEGTWFILSFASAGAQTDVYAFDTSDGTWELIDTINSSLPSEISAVQVGSRLYFTGYGVPGYIERTSPLFGSAGWLIRVDDGVHTPPEWLKELNGLWAADVDVSQSDIAALPDTGASALQEVLTSQLPATLRTPTGERVDLNGVPSNTGLSTGTFRIGFHSLKVALDISAIQPLSYPVIFAPRLVTAHQGRLVFLDLFNSIQQVLFLNQEGRIVFSAAYDDTVVFPSIPVDDSSPIDISLTMENGARILWAVSYQKFFFVGFATGLAVIYAEPITPNTVGNIARVPYPLADVPAVGGTEYLLMVSRRRDAVLALRYDDLGQSFVPRDTTTLATHLFEDRVNALWWLPYFRQDSRSFVFARTDSGSVRVGTDVSNGNVVQFAWSRFEFAPGSDYTLVDILSVDGEPWLLVDSPKGRGLLKFVDHEDVAVDGLVSGVADGNGDFSVPGVADGETLFFFAYESGEPVASGAATVASGKISVGYPGATVVAGYAFEMDFKVPPINALVAQGHFEGDFYRKLRAQLRVINTRQIAVNNSPIGDQVPAAPASVIPPKSEFLEVPFIGWERDAQVHISGVLGFRFSLATMYLEYEA